MNLGQDEQDLQDVDELTQKVIGAAYQVHNTLGFGFLESVYENSLLVELEKLGLKSQQQAQINVLYRKQQVGHFIADILIEDRLIIELKSVSTLTLTHEVQLVNYLSATGIENGLLLNFGPEKVDVKRKFKTHRTQGLSCSSC